MPAALLLLLAAVSLPPKPDHYVTDRAAVLRNADALNEKLANFERQTSDQIVVEVDQHLPADATIEEMDAEAMRKGGVGQKGKDNGAILFVFHRRPEDAYRSRVQARRIADRRESEVDHQHCHQAGVPAR